MAGSGDILQSGANEAQPGPYKVLSIIFPGFNTLDLNGPLDVFTKSGQWDKFEVTIAAENEITESVEGLQVKRKKALVIDKSSPAQSAGDAEQLTIAEACAQYDILHIAGGGTDMVQTQAKLADSAFMQLIKQFAKTSPSKVAGQKPRPRILLSICTGAAFPGAMGVFNGRACTTHWGFCPKLVTILQQAADAAAKQSGCGVSPGTVLRARYVDSGSNDAGVQIISSGGISCGIDAALHVVDQLEGQAAAQGVCEILDYAWHKTAGLITTPVEAPPQNLRG
ncbi:class I glutamine amidotransferase-like protein [Microdochium bolleyi]|uniref:Class I glutamine amidotransferase-like protein n=1 Tax=Microdochium bolleyi TaxID=196109 RepID=A0A136IM99_9PEZI|nr:class I glutamine amidotransferase-like protein [Microdochium bolleyi]